LKNNIGSTLGHFHQHPQSHSDSFNDSTDTQSVQGGDDNLMINDFPQNQTDINNIRVSIGSKM